MEQKEPIEVKKRKKEDNSDSDNEHDPKKQK
jgi:hypothetical protein